MVTYDLVASSCPLTKVQRFWLRMFQPERRLLVGKWIIMFVLVCTLTICLSGCKDETEPEGTPQPGGRATTRTLTHSADEINAEARARIEAARKSVEQAQE